MSYFNARFYDPAIGRFVSLDPIKSGANWYVYCENNPLKYVDPDGLEIHLAAGAGFGNDDFNHVYVYSTETEQGKGMFGSSGVNLGDGVGDIPNDPYIVVDIGDMTDKEFMDKMEAYDKWHDWLYLPGLNDCHNNLEDAFKFAGVKYPGWPDGRINSENITDFVKNLFFWLIFGEFLPPPDRNGIHTPITKPSPGNSDQDGHSGWTTSMHYY